MRYLSRLSALLLGSALPLSASTVTYDFGQTSSGASPDGPPPWLQAVFTDDSQPANTVQLTLSAGNLTGNEYLSSLYFNLNPLLDPTTLSFSVTGSTGSFIDPSVQRGANSFKAGPDGKFDFLLGFNTTGDNSSRFTSGDSVTFTITSLTGLTAQDFDALSTCAGGSGSYSSAANIDGIPLDQTIASGWINPTFFQFSDSVDRPSVPDSATTFVLLGISLLAMEGCRRMRQSETR